MNDKFTLSFTTKVVRVSMARWAIVCLALLCARRGLAERVFQGGVPFPLPEIAADLVVADLNLDGRPDVAAVKKGGVFALLGEKGSLLGPPQPYASGLAPITLAAGDLDGDGAPDLV